MLWIWKRTCLQSARGAVENLRSSVPILACKVSELRLLASAVASHLMRPLPAGSQACQFCRLTCCRAPAQTKFPGAHCIGPLQGSDASLMDVRLLSCCVPGCSFPLQLQTDHSFLWVCVDTCRSASSAIKPMFSHRPSLQTCLKATVRRLPESASVAFRHSRKQWTESSCCLSLCLRLATCIWTTQHRLMRLRSVHHHWVPTSIGALLLWQVELPTSFSQASGVCLLSPRAAADLRLWEQASTCTELPCTLLQMLSLRSSLLLDLNCRSDMSLVPCRKLVRFLLPRTCASRVGSAPQRPQSGILAFGPARLPPDPQLRQVLVDQKAFSCAVSGLLELICTGSGFYRQSLTTPLQALILRLATYPPIAVRKERRRTRKVSPKVVVCKVKLSPSRSSFLARNTRDIAMRFHRFICQLFELLMTGHLPLQVKLPAMPSSHTFRLLSHWHRHVRLRWFQDARLQVLLQAALSTRRKLAPAHCGHRGLKGRGTVLKGFVAAKLPGWDFVRLAWLAGGFSDSALLHGLMLSHTRLRCHARCSNRRLCSCACVPRRRFPRSSCSYREAKRGALQLDNERRRPASRLRTLTLETWRLRVLPGNAICLLVDLTGVRASICHSPPKVCKVSLCTLSCIDLFCRTGQVHSLPALSPASFFQHAKIAAVQLSFVPVEVGTGRLAAGDMSDRRHPPFRRVFSIVGMHAWRRLLTLKASWQLERSRRHSAMKLNPPVHPVDLQKELPSVSAAARSSSCASLRAFLKCNKLCRRFPRVITFGQFLGTESRSLLSVTWLQVSQLRLLASKVASGLRSVAVACCIAQPARGHAKPCYAALSDSELTRRSLKSAWLVKFAACMHRQAPLHLSHRATVTAKAMTSLAPRWRLLLKATGQRLPESASVAFRHSRKQWTESSCCLSLCLRLATCIWTTQHRLMRLRSVHHRWVPTTIGALLLWQVELPTSFSQASGVCLLPSRAAADLRLWEQASTCTELPCTLLQMLSLRSSLLLDLSCRSDMSPVPCRKLVRFLLPRTCASRVGSAPQRAQCGILAFGPARLPPDPQLRQGKFAALPPVVALFSDLLCGCSSPAHVALCWCTAGTCLRRLRRAYSSHGGEADPSSFRTAAHRGNSEATVPGWLYALCSSRLLLGTEKSFKFKRPKPQTSWWKMFATRQRQEASQVLAVTLIAGGARTTFQGSLPGYLSHLCRLSCGGNTCYVHPVEDALLTAAFSLCLLKLVQWMNVGALKRAQPSQQWSCPLETVLVAHSFGALIAYSLAQQLETYGFLVPAIIALDTRSGAPRQTFSQLQPVALSQNRAPFHFHLETAKAAYMAPHAPRFSFVSGFE